MIGYYLTRLLRKLRPRAIGASLVHKQARIGPGSQVLFSRLDRYSYCGADCVVLSADIGAFCSIADNVIIGGAQHAMSSVSSSPIFHQGRNVFGVNWAAHPAPETLRTGVGNDVWIGNGAKIRGGVSIGNGAVVGAGAVVTKDVDPYAVVAGVPAEFIRYRFDESVRRRLEATRWWDWPEEKLKVLSRDFNDPIRFLEEIE